MDPKTILGINAIITANKPKTFEELRLLVNQSEFKNIPDDALAAFGLRPAEPEPAMKKETIKKTAMKEIKQSLLGSYMEMVSDVKALRQQIVNIDCSGSHDAVIVKIDELITKHTNLVKESDIWK